MSQEEEKLIEEFNKKVVESLRLAYQEWEKECHNPASEKGEMYAQFWCSIWTEPFLEKMKNLFQESYRSGKRAGFEFVEKELRDLLGRDYEEKCCLWNAEKILNLFEEEKKKL